MNGANFCPNCGYNQSPDTSVERDGFTIHPFDGAEFRGTRIKLPTSILILFHTVAASKAPVALDVIAERMGTDSDGYANLVAVQKCRLGKQLSAIGAPMPVRSVNRRGLVWDVAA